MYRVEGLRHKRKKCLCSHLQNLERVLYRRCIERALKELTPGWYIYDFDRLEDAREQLAKQLEDGEAADHHLPKDTSDHSLSLIVTESVFKERPYGWFSFDPHRFEPMRQLVEKVVAKEEGEDEKWKHSEQRECYILLPLHYCPAGHD